MDARRAAERGNDQPGIVGENDFVREAAVMQRFARGIFRERRRRFIEGGNFAKNSAADRVRAARRAASSRYSRSLPALDEASSRRRGEGMVPALSRAATEIHVQQFLLNFCELANPAGGQREQVLKLVVA